MDPAVLWRGPSRLSGLSRESGGGRERAVPVLLSVITRQKSQFSARYCTGKDGRTPRDDAGLRPQRAGRGRGYPERDWQDAALLLTLITDPLAVADELTAKDRKRLAGLRPLLKREHIGWATFTAEDHHQGAAALLFLLEPPAQPLA